MLRQDAGPFVCNAPGYAIELYQQADFSHRVTLNYSHWYHMHERSKSVRQKRRGMKAVERFAITVLGLVSVFGCATSKNAEVDLPGGETGYSVSCGNSRSWEKCFSKASELCGSGYEIVSRQTQAIDDPASVKEGVYVRPYAERILVFKCI